MFDRECESKAGIRQNVGTGRGSRLWRDVLPFVCRSKQSVVDMLERWTLGWNLVIWNVIRAFRPLHEVNILVRDGCAGEIEYFNYSQALIRSIKSQSQAI